MKTEHLNKIKELLERYQMGQTSLEEEKALISYFNSKEIHPELQKFQDEFTYYYTFTKISHPGHLKDLDIPNEHSFINNIKPILSSSYFIPGILLLSVLLFIVIYTRQSKEEVQKIEYQENESTILLPNQKDDSLTTKDIEIQTDNDYVEPKSDPNSSIDVPLKSKDSVTISAPDSLIHKKISPLTIDEDLSENIPSPNLLQNEISEILIENRDTSIDLDSPKTPINYSKEQSEKSIVTEQSEAIFNITETSTSKELSRLAYLANKAGIEYTYIVDRHRRKIHELNIVMVIRSTGQRSQLWLSVPKKSSFSEEIKWRVDENGQAINLGESKIDHKVKAIHPLE